MQAFSGISFARKSITKINTKNKTSIMIEQVKLKKIKNLEKLSQKVLRPKNIKLLLKAFLIFHIKTFKYIRLFG